MAQNQKEKKVNKTPTIASLQAEVQSLKDDYKVFTNALFRHIDMKFKKHQLDVDTLVHNITVSVREEIRSANRKPVQVTQVIPVKKSYIKWLWTGDDKYKPTKK